MKTSEVLQKALELFGPNGEKWVSHSPYDFLEQCTLTAMANAYMKSGEDGPYTKVVNALKDAAGYHDYLGDWNDTHTWPEVKAAFEQAIKNCQQAGQ